MNLSCVNDTKTFWKTVKPLFSSENIALVENNEIIDESGMLSQIFSDFFSNAVNNLGIIREDWGRQDIDVCNIPDPVLKAIIRYENHPSILKIAESMRDQSQFSFTYTTYECVYSEINYLNNSTAYPKNTIPPNIIKENYDIFTLKLLNDFNYAITYSIYPGNFKNADITSAREGSDKTDKSNYRPVCIPPSISKIYERLLYCQINTYMDDKLAIYQCGFRKAFSVQNCLILMVEK